MSALHRKLTTVAINVQQTKENCLPLFPYIVYATDFFFFNLFGMDFSSHSIFNDPNSVCHLKNERVCRIKLRETKKNPFPFLWPFDYFCWQYVYYIPNIRRNKSNIKNNTIPITTTITNHTTKSM